MIKINRIELLVVLFLLPLLVGCTSTPLSQFTSTDNNGDNDTLSGGNNEQTDLIPILVYQGLYLEFYDYTNNKSFEIPGTLVNQKYIYNSGIVMDLSTQERLNSVDKDRCVMYKAAFISDDEVLVFGCYSENGDGNNRIMPVWNLQTGEIVREIAVDEDLDNFFDILVSPEKNMFLLASNSICSKVFSTNTLEQITPTNTEDCNYLNMLVPSANRKYFLSVGNEFSIWKWVPDGIEKIDSVALTSIAKKVVDPNTDEILYYTVSSLGQSISDDGKYIAYPDSNNSFSLIELDTGKIDYVVTVENAQTAYTSALSPDNKFLFVSKQEESGVSNGLFVYDIAQNTMVYKRLDVGNGIPTKLRVEYLPKSILTSWNWTSGQTVP